MHFPLLCAVAVVLTWRLIDLQGFCCAAVGAEAQPSVPGSSFDPRLWEMPEEGECSGQCCREQFDQSEMQQ